MSKQNIGIEEIHKIMQENNLSFYDIVLSEYVFDKDGLHATISLNGGKVTIRIDIEQIHRYY